MKNFTTRLIGVITILSFCYFSSSAQRRLIGERGIHLQTFISPVLINPGATGFGAGQELIFNYRNAWATFPGSPRTVTFSYDGPIANRLGLGLQLWSDRFAAFESTKGQIALAYQLHSDINKVGFGLTAEYIQHKLSNSDLSPLIDMSDRSIMEALDGSQYFDVTFGIHGLYDKKVIYGLVLPSLVSSRISETVNDLDNTKEFGYIINLGYRAKLDDHDIVLEPSIYVKQLMLTPFHVDLYLKADFLDEKLTGGINYTIGADRRLGFLLGAKVSNFGFYYSYNISFHEFQDYNNGSHEFSLKFNLSSVNGKMHVIEN